MDKQDGFYSWLDDDFEATNYREWVANHVYDNYNRKTTVVVLKLNSGFEITGVSSCEDPSKFSEELGHKYALKDALRKLGEFAAFYRAQKKLEEPLVLKKRFTDEEREVLRKVWNEL